MTSNWRESLKKKVSDVTSSSLTQTLTNQLSQALISTKQNASSAMTYLKHLAVSEPEKYTDAEDLGMYYITSRIIAMPFPQQDTLFSHTPFEKSITQHTLANKLSHIISESLAQKISRHLNKYHCNHYMVWNLSEISYNSDLLALFSDQVIEFKFPGYPTPPLQQLFQLLTSLDSWLKVHDNNVAVIHCQTGKGRTVTTISAYLAWSGYKETPMEALEHTCAVMHSNIKSLTIPSQTRYLAYLTKILIDRQRPKSRAVTIERIVIHGIPYFEVPPQFEDDNSIELQENIGDNNEVKAIATAPETEHANIQPATIDSTQPAPSQSSENIKTNDEKENEQNEEPDDMIQTKLNIEKEKQHEAHEAKSGDVAGTTDSNKELPSKTNETTQQQNEEKKEKEERETKEVKIIGRPQKKDLGIRPYIQIFKDGKLVWTSRNKKKPLPFYEQADRSIKVVVQKEIEGDILIRIRHLCLDNRTKISVCRFAFHTGYVEDHGVIRFRKSQLDGAWNSNRFPKDFMIDMVIGNSKEDNAQSRFSEQFWNEIERRSLALEKARIAALEQQQQQKEQEKPQSSLEEKNNAKEDLLQKNNLSSEPASIKKEPEAQFVVGTVEDEHLFDDSSSDDDLGEGFSELQDRSPIIHPNSKGSKNTETKSDAVKSTPIKVEEREEEKQKEQEQESEKQESEKQESEEREQESEEIEQKPKEKDDKEPGPLKEILADMFGGSNHHDSNDIDALDDLEKLADGLDLDNLEVDPDTEQYVENLSHQYAGNAATIKSANMNELDLLGDIPKSEGENENQTQRNNLTRNNNSNENVMGSMSELP